MTVRALAARGARRRAAAALALLALAAGCSGGGTGSSTPSDDRSAGAAAGGGALSTEGTGQPLPAPRLDLSDCTDAIRFPAKGQPGADRKLTFACGYLTVPVAYAKPTGAKLKIFVIRARLGSSAPARSLAVNPGGPGGSGVNLAVQMAFELPTEVLSHYDLIGFDPRGVGLSSGIHCVPDALKDKQTAEPADATTDAEFDAELAIARQGTDACVTKYGDQLAHINTTEAARDMDLLRRALGATALNYLGYSYGTELGAVYATLFPAQVGAFVLDGAVDPTESLLTGTETQARGFEDAFDQYANACVRAGNCPLGGDPRAFVMNLTRQAKAHPIPSGDSKDKRTATDGNVLLAVLAALYDRDAWPRLTSALTEARNGDAKGVLGLDDAYNQRSADGKFSNILDVNVAVNCNDGAPADAVTADTVKRTAAQWRTKYPMFGAPLALTLLSCLNWRLPHTPLPTVTAGTAANTILVVGTRHDPATPYVSARHLRTALGRAVLLTWDGDGHTAYPKTKCVTSAVDAYLIGGTLPTGSATCPANG